MAGATFVLAMAASLWGARRPGGDGTFTVPGQMDQARYLALGAFKPLEDIQKADQLFRRREYEQAIVAYAHFIATHGRSPEEAPRRVVPYATLMQGVCSLMLKKHDDAQDRLESVIKNWPDGEDATVARFQLGQCHRERGDDLAAMKVLEGYIADPDRVPDRDSLQKARLYMVERYALTRYATKASQDRWASLWMEVLAADPKLRGRGWEDLMEHYKTARDWENLRKAAAFRMSLIEADIYVIDTCMRLLTIDLEDCRDDAARSAALKPKLSAFVKDLRPRLEHIKSIDLVRYGDLVMRVIGFCCRCGLSDAGEVMAGWMKDHPGDRMALHAYAGYVKLGAWDEPTFDKVVLDYLKAHPTDAGVRDLYVKTVRQLSSQPEKALAVIRDYGGGPWELATFWRDIDNSKAAAAYVEVFNDQKQSDARRLAAAWGAAETYRSIKDYRQAIGYYIRSEKVGCESYHRLAECYYRTGQWQQAVEAWRKVLEERRDRRFGAEASFNIAKTLLENKDPQGAKLAADLARSTRENSPYYGPVRALCRQYDVPLPAPK
jgi:tetratricopeptide (TPR) repeat protein